MDAHFHEYLAAIAGMHDIYGDFGDDHPSEFHQASECCAAGTATTVVAVVELGAASSSV
jgi:hypothetical protein